MKLNLHQISFVYLALTSLLACVQGKGGSGGSGSGSGGGGGGGGRGGGSRGGIGRSSSAKVLTKSRAAVILGSGAAGYAAYKGYKRNRDDKDKDSLDSDSFEYADIDGRYDYKTQESTSYYASEGIGMSAWALICLILGIIGLGTLGWYCCNVFLPVWQDNRNMQRQSMIGRRKDEMPLQETPSTATPSP